MDWIREIDFEVVQSSEEQTAPQGTKKEQAQPTFSAATAASVAWLVFLGFGGFFLTLYYRRVGYFPELEWEESFTYLAAISFLGGGLAVLYSLLLMIPGIIWSEFLIFDTVLSQAMCYHSKPNSAEPCYKSLFQKIVIPFAILMFVVHLAGLASLILAVVSAAVGLLVLCGYSYRIFQGTLREIQWKLRSAFILDNEAALLHKYTAAAGVAAFASLVSLLIIYSILSPRDVNPALLFICTTAVVVSNFLVAVQFHDKIQRAFVTSIVTALVLLTCGEILGRGQAALSMRLMDQFGLGGKDRRNSVTLVVGEAGSAILTANHIKSTPVGKYAAVENVRILSRLGDEYFIEAQKRRVALPKSVVLSWSKVRPDRN